MYMKTANTFAMITVYVLVSVWVYLYGNVTVDMKTARSGKTGGKSGRELVRGRRKKGKGKGGGGGQPKSGRM